MNRDIFETYLEQRYQKAGALTPGQKLEVIAQLEAEARQEGRVPVGANSVARMPVDHPAFQAVLRGEEVSLGGLAVSKPRQKEWLDRLAELPTPAKIGVLAGVMLVLVLLGSLVIGLGGRKAEPTPTPEPTATLAPTQPPAPSVPPPPPSTPTVVMLLGAGGPAENSRDPASIEIAGRLFILARGVVKEDGSWQPQGPEWLNGTEVRRVFAIPYDQLGDAQVEVSDPIYVRTRGGSVLTYLVRDVVRLQANQIESFFSLRPSLVVALPMAGGDVTNVERVVIFGEAQVEQVAVEAVSETSSSYGSGAANTYTLGGVNLRDNPGLSSRVLVGLPAGTPLTLSWETPPVTLDDLTWVYVLSPYGYGWVAKQMIAMP